MAMSDGTKKILKWVVAGLLTIGLVFVIIALIKASKPIQNEVQPNPNPPSQGQGAGLNGILSAIGGFLGGLFGGAWSNVATGGNVACDPNRKGYNIDGVKDPACGADFTNCDPDKCDPNTAGWNECGFPDTKC